MNSVSEVTAAEKERPLGPDEVLKQIATYKYGQSRKSLIAVTDLVRDSYNNAERRKELRKRFIALLRSDATTDCKRFVCKQLSIIGAAKVAPALAKLLTEEKLSHMARFALERIPGAPAGAALRDSMSKLKGKLLIGVINSLGVRRDRPAVRALSEFLTGPDETVAGAAAAALGKIGVPQAAEALARASAKASPKLRAIIIDARLRCAERLLAEGKKGRAARIFREISAQAKADHVRAAARRALKAARRGLKPTRQK